MLDINHKASV